MSYDSTLDTESHQRRVNQLLTEIERVIARSARCHDASKLGPDEKPAFDEFTPGLKDSTYGSEKYKARLAALGPALSHHYAVNSHHPEHYPDGVDGMTLIDLIEMLADWKAAGERHANGSIEKSLAHNRGRFQIGPQLHRILCNTVEAMGWANAPPAKAEKEG